MAVKDPAAPPAPGDPPPPFDPVAFKTDFTKELTTLLNTTVNNAVKNVTTELSKKFQPLKAADDPPPPADDPPPSDPKIVKDTPALNAEVQRLTRTVGELQKENKESKARVETETKLRMENERVTEIRNILNEITFKDQASRDLFFRGFERDIKRDDSGNLIAEAATGILPAKDYLMNLAEQHGNLLAPQGKSGAGATAGTRGPGGKKWTLADMTPANINALKPEEQGELLRLAAAGEIR